MMADPVPGVLARPSSLINERSPTNDADVARQESSKIALGIDFGTSTCRVVVVKDGAHHELQIPSVVALGADGGLLAGWAASKIATERPLFAARAVKRLLGRRVGSPEIEWLASGSSLIMEQTAHGIGLVLGDTLFSVQALSHALMQHVVEEAERACQVHAGRRRRVPAVVTIPAMFDMPQRLALARVAKHAGIDVKRFVESPAAALLAMSLPPTIEKVAVAELGAGYFDVCIAERQPRGWKILGSEGDTLLGTDDFDYRVMSMLIAEFFGMHAYDLSANSLAIARLRAQAAKIRLHVRRRQPSATLLANIARVNGRDLPLVHPPVSARELERLVDGDLAAIVPPCQRLFGDLRMGTDDVDAVVVLGHGAQIPFVPQRFAEMFRVEPIVPKDAEMFPARGAAALALATTSEGARIQSVLPHTLSVRPGQRPPIQVSKRHEPIPFTSTHFFKPDVPNAEAVDLVLLQGECEHDFNAFQIARARLEQPGDGSYVVEIGLDERGVLAFSAQPSTALSGARSSEAPGVPGSEPPTSHGTPEVVVEVEGLDEELLDAYLASLDDDELEGGQPTIQAHRIAGAAAEAAVPSSRPHQPLRRSMFARDASADTIAATVHIPSSMHPPDEAGANGPMSLRSAADPLVGKILGGRYELMAILGEGSMARVYTARHQILGSTYAVKVMHSSLASNAELRERFLREARAAAAIDSDHVVRILDFGKIDESRDYFVMEYLQGTTLEDEIRRRLVPIALVVNAMVQVSKGLMAAHEHNIVHRDLKPENVLITRMGESPRVKILDFGVAKIPTAEAGLTMGNSIIGTPYYMAPEQVIGGVDLRTDIYASGIMMYELVTGSLPFHHESLAHVLAMQCDMALPSPRQVAGPNRCSAELDVLIRKCAEKKKDDRFQTALELRTALHRVQAQLPSA